MIGKSGTTMREQAAALVAIWLLTLRWGLCLAGTAFLVVAVVLGANTLLFLRTSVAETGTVVSNVRVDRRDANDGLVTTTFAPEFTFSAADGRSYTVTSASSSSPPEFAEGQEVRVLYNPASPGSARIDTFWQMWGMATLFGAIGAFVGAIGYSWMYFAVKRNRQILSIR